ncbi:hypothetical protein ParKJ_34655 [Paraburkholderia fungorum]|jgi:hypothetical protein|uniref:Uncharacterized protein n=1 Tax=Paraburkholderia fungorum TaxID=134537 RepID=A0AAP5UZV8_9BURK|nr:hypothetical protein [Paraburkholderia fungorum]MDT8842579.1 hypothetical protein [Paraburkholderia fungorum]
MQQNGSSMSTAKAVRSLFVGGFLSAVLGFVVSMLANQLPEPVLTTLSQWYMHRREMGSGQIGWTFAAFLAMTAVLFAVSLVPERKQKPWLASVGRFGRWVTGKLMSRAVKLACFVCGALAAFGGIGWLAAALTLTMYVGIFIALHGLAAGAQMRPRP